MEDKSNKCLIFVGTKRTADEITRVRINQFPQYAPC